MSYENGKYLRKIIIMFITVNYVAWKPYCCLPQGEKDKECTPIKIPDDDPILRFGNLRCMKMTRPLSYQSVGCLKENSPPERVCIFILVTLVCVI